MSAQQTSAVLPSVMADAEVGGSDVDELSPPAVVSVLPKQQPVMSSQHASAVDPSVKAEDEISCYASHCPCDFETPPWVFRYPETAPAIGSSDGDRSGADPISGSRTYSGALVIWAEKRPTPQG